MTQRLYYTDAYLREFRGRIVGREGDGVYLDRTAFYPASGGQPYDLGEIGGVAVREVVDEGDRILHRLESPVGADEVDCLVDWGRRFDHMQQHTGQHLLSAVFAHEFGHETISFHLGQEVSTVDLATPSLDAATIRAAEAKANQIVFENRTVIVSFEHASEVHGLRKASEREGTLRIVAIHDLDRSACGGTHVRATGEIGPILIRKTEKIRNSIRVEFLCGDRAIRRARADFDALSKIAQTFSATLDETPALVAAQMETARNAEKTERKLAAELARYQGRELYAATEPDADGIRRIIRREPRGSLELLRPLAQSFTDQPKAIFLSILEDPPAVLLAVSADAGVDAGKSVQAAVRAVGGRGGGAARLAQGSVPDRESLAKVVEALTTGK